MDNIQESGRDLSSEVRSLLLDLSANTRDSVNGLNEPIKSVEMTASGLGKRVVELKHALDEKSMTWQEAGATSEEARYLNDLYAGEVGQ